MDENECIRQVLAGDQAAYRMLVEKYKNQVFGLAYKMLGGAEDAEDAAQEVFVRAYTRLRTYDQSRKFSTWLLSITSHLCIDELRRKRLLWHPLDDVAGVLESGEKGPETEAIDEEERRRVRNLLQYLPPKYRTVIVLRYWHDLSIIEIGEAIGATEAAVKTMLHRGRQMLAKRMLEKEANSNALSTC